MRMNSDGCPIFGNHRNQVIQNDLSDDDVKNRANILKESFAEDAELIIKKLLKTTLEKRSLDYLRQTLVFNFVYKHTNYFKSIK